MNEILASVVGAALVIGLAVPVSTLVAKAILVARWRRDADPRRHGSLATFLVLVAPSLGVVLWFVSAALHLSEPGAATSACTNGPVGAAVFVRALLLALLLSGLAATALTGGWWRAASRPRSRRGTLAAGHDERLVRACRSHPRLARLAPRIVAVGAGEHPIATRGLFRPVIEVDAGHMDRLSDDALVAALLHEAEHHGARDPLRYLVGGASLALNPFGFMLRNELRRWRAAREAVCDEWAVRRGADPLALADALVSVAKLGRSLHPLEAGLGGSAAGLLRLRVQLLVEYASRPVGPASAAPVWAGVAAVSAFLVAPHVLGAWPLDLVHRALEHALPALGLG